MCGRYTLSTTIDALRRAFADVEFPGALAPRFNIAPSQEIGVIASDAPNKFVFFEWGLLPAWVKDPAKGARPINARAESIAEKPYFRTAFRKKRCLVPADGFYEWKAEPGAKAKTPYHIRMKSREPFAFAGIWDRWGGGENEIASCALITTEPNAVLAPIHNRMPVILAPEDYALWLAADGKDAPAAAELLRPFDAKKMEAFPVSRAVNNPRHDAPDCAEPAPE